MSGHTLRRVLSIMMAMGFLFSTGIVGCSPCGILPIPGAEPEVVFWASEEVVPPGGCAMLHWEVHAAEEYTVFLNGREVGMEGEDEVCLEEPTTFELVVGVPGGSIKETVRIGVEGEVPPEEPPPGEPPPQEPPPEEPAPEGGPEVIVFEVHPDVVPQGGCAMLFWEVHPPGEWRVLLDGQEVPPLGEREECPQATTTYELLVEAPGGPQGRTVTLHMEAGPGPEPTPPPPGPTATSPPPAPGATATSPPPAATPTPFVPRWGQCSWVGVESAGINSHQPVTWCANGSFLTGLDLDRQAIDPLDSPVIGQAHCCPLSVAQFSPWGQCSWVGVESAGINSHQPVAWCPDGQYLTGLDLDRQAIDPLDSPVIGQGFCCPLGDPKYTGWDSCSWVKVEQGGINSHQPVTWCPNGSFVVGLDLDRQAIDPLDSPVIGQALCCRP